MSRPRTLTPSASPMHFFGSEVRRAREAAGMSQTELGELVPCDKSVVSRVEASLTMPEEAFALACDAAFPSAGDGSRGSTGTRAPGATRSRPHSASSQMMRLRQPRCTRSSMRYCPVCCKPRIMPARCCRSTPA